MQSAINLLQSSVGVSYTIAAKPIEGEIEATSLQIAIEQHVLRYLEGNGWWKIRLDSPVICRGNSTSDFALSHFNISCNFLASSGQFTQFGRGSQMATVTSELFLVLSGQITYLARCDAWAELTTSDGTRIARGESVRLDSLPCSVLPNCTHAFAVRAGAMTNRALIDYWRFVHGIWVDADQKVFEVSFTPGDETVTLTYPSQCVLQRVPFLEKPMRKHSDGASDFEHKFTKEVQAVVDAIRADLED
jgi:hypothetical protein